MLTAISSTLMRGGTSKGLYFLKDHLPADPSLRNQVLYFTDFYTENPDAYYATVNNFARESHLDEVAAALGIDPVELRLRHLIDPRLADVLTRVAEHVDWANRRTGLGIACGVEKGGRVATAAEVTVDAGGTVRVTRLVTGIDCGPVIDPSGLRNQVVGATVMGLGGALFEAVRFDRGRITSTSLSSLPCVS